MFSRIPVDGSIELLFWQRRTFASAEQSGLINSSESQIQNQGLYRMSWMYKPSPTHLTNITSECPVHQPMGMQSKTYNTANSK